MASGYEEPTESLQSQEPPTRPIQRTRRHKIKRPKLAKSERANHFKHIVDKDDEEHIIRNQVPRATGLIALELRCGRAGPVLCLGRGKPRN
jgi:hypothetical protein